MSRNVKDEMDWKQFFSVILMYIIGWRCVLFVTPTPMTLPEGSEYSQNGHFGGFWPTPPTLRFISEKFFKYKKCSYCTEWWSYIIRSPPGGFGGQLNFHPIPPLTAHCALVSTGEHLVWCVLTVPSILVLYSLVITQHITDKLKIIKFLPNGSDVIKNINWNNIPTIF